MERKAVTSESDLLDTVYLENLQDALYSVTVSNVTADTSMESIVETRFVRPYTVEHEGLRSFSRGITNFYPLGDKLAVVLDEDSEYLEKMIFHFWGTDGKEHEWDIQKGMHESLSNGELYATDSRGRGTRH